MSKVVLITNIPTPYRIPLFNELHGQLAAKGIAFKVVFAALGYARRKWAIDMAQCAFPWEELSSGRVPSADPESALFTYPGLGRVLNRENGALLITGGFSPASTKIWLRSWYRRTPYLIWSGAILRKGEKESPLRVLQRRLLVSRARGFITYGTRARGYLVSLGADPSRVSIGINTVDTTFFQTEAERHRNDPAGAEGPRRILYVGHLTRGKRIDLVLRALAQLKSQRSDFLFQLVGSGQEEASLKKLTADLGLESCVSFEGFRQKQEIPRYLAEAACFIFPSEYDVWGLVLVEAMAAGVVSVSSIHSGATQDLIHDGSTGFALDFEDTDAVAQRLNWVLGHPDEARQIGRQAQRFIQQQVTIEKSARGFVEAVERGLPS